MAQPDPTPQRSRPDLLKVIGLPLLLVVLVAAGFLLRNTLWKFVSSPEDVRVWISQWGVIAPLVFFGIQILQVVIFVIPGDTVQAAGGFLFGFWPALALTVTGIAAGSTINFWTARALGRPLVERFFPRDQIDRLGAIANGSRAQIGFFLLFVIPGIPKDVLCYVAGLSPMRFVFFLVVSIIGRMPGIIGSTLMGSTAAQQRWTLTAILFAAAILLFAVGYSTRDRLHTWIDSLARRNKE
jgi:uncharacterized membrane protein YdjX (TVP38/TMEM64 family)